MTDTQTGFRSRIVGHDDVDPKQLAANPLNWRLHPSHQRAAVMGVLEEVGWVQDVIVNRTTGNLVDGHLRVELAVEQNEPTVPVGYVELSEAEERMILATLDPLAALAQTDAQLLGMVMDGLHSQDEVLQAFLEDMAQSHEDVPPPPAATPHEDDFWPRVTFKLPHNAYASWQAAVAAQEGDTETDRIINMLSALGFTPSEADD